MDINLPGLNGVECVRGLKQELPKIQFVMITSGNAKFFLGTDSAPHTVETKESSCGCAGCYTAHAAMPFYAEVFEEEGALDKLEGFASHFGPDFYGKARNTEQITLFKDGQLSPASLSFGARTVPPLRAGEPLSCRLATAG